MKEGNLLEGADLLFSQYIVYIFVIQNVYENLKLKIRLVKKIIQYRKLAKPIRDEMTTASRQHLVVSAANESTHLLNTLFGE